MDSANKLFSVEIDRPEENLIKNFDNKMIRKYVSKLSYTQRVFITLRYGEELPYKKIAEILNTSEDYLGVLNYRILKNSREKGGLQDDE